ncbi:MAG: AbrB/MazE/SpoVT family DNA-binding domain-containing protein [Sulfolobales archaeon]
MSSIVRVSKKNTIYIPKDIAEKLGIVEGSYLELRVEGDKLVAIPIPNPFWLALKGTKFAETTLKEIERVSEEEQSRYEGENSS